MFDIMNNYKNKYIIESNSVWLNFFPTNYLTITRIILVYFLVM